MLPRITSDLAQAKLDIGEYGLALVSDQLTDEQLRLARAATYAGAEEDKRLGREANRFALDYGEGNVRVWNVLNRHPVFAELVQAPAVVELLREVIGWPALLGNLSANIAQKGNGGGMWHQDQLFVPKPWPPRPQGMNVGWLLDDYTEDNGATEVVPKSHEDADSKLNPKELDSRALPVVAPAGTLMIMESRVWHRTGCNLSGATRAALFGWYTRPIYRTQENWFLSLDEGFADNASDDLLTLLGFRAQGLGLVYGRSPK